MMPSVWEIMEILVAGVATLAIYSFLWRENKLYRFFEHLFIGISVGLGIVETVKNYLWPKGFEPMIEGAARVLCRIGRVEPEYGELASGWYVLILGRYLRRRGKPNFANVMRWRRRHLTRWLMLDLALVAIPPIVWLMWGLV